MTNFPKKVFQDEDYEKPLDKLGKYFVLSHVFYITTPIHFVCMLMFLYILISLPKFDGIEAWIKYIYIYIYIYTTSEKPVNNQSYGVLDCYGITILYK